MGELKFPRQCPMCGHVDPGPFGSMWNGPVWRRERGSDKSFRLFRCSECGGYIAWRNDDQLIQRDEWQSAVDIEELGLP